MSMRRAGAGPRGVSLTPGGPLFGLLAEYQPRPFPNLITGIFVLELEMTACLAKRCAVVDGGEGDDIANAAAAVQEIAAIFLHVTPRPVSTLSVSRLYRV